MLNLQKYNAMVVKTTSKTVMETFQDVPRQRGIYAETTLTIQNIKQIQSINLPI